LNAVILARRVQNIKRAGFELGGPARVRVLRQNPPLRHFADDGGRSAQRRPIARFPVGNADANAVQ